MQDMVRQLHIGDLVFITGTIYAARDAAHKRMDECLDRGEPLPADLSGQIIYYVGPSPAKPGQDFFPLSCDYREPTTSGRMDAYTPRLLQLGLAGMIGKGNRSAQVMEAIKKNTCVYLAATGGAGALLSRCIRKYTVIAWADLGTEAFAAMDVKDFPATVVADCWGGDLYAEGQRAYRTI